MHDAHFHLSDALLRSMGDTRLGGIANAASKQEYEALRNYPWLVSAGVHPWYAAQTDWEELLPCLMDADFIGEIGLDSVWCSTPLPLQREIFEKQLALAQQLQKPVLLHTKGMEEEILARIRQHPNTYIVHWYSAKEHLQGYLDMGCYCTIGPSVGCDEAVDAVCRRCPSDRLLLETDGLEAIAWAYGCPETEVSYSAALARSVEQIAALRGLTVSQAEALLDENFHRLTASLGRP